MMVVKNGENTYTSVINLLKEICSENNLLSYSQQKFLKVSIWPYI